MIRNADISQYLKMRATPPGAILLHILRASDITQAELSRLAGIRPQHINALTKGTRRFSLSYSFAIEKVLGISHSGFFYQCQSNYDITMYARSTQPRPNVTNLRKATFWDVNLDTVDWNRGKRWAILRVLEYGSKSDFDELSKFYGRESFEKEIGDMPSRLSASVRHNAMEFGLL